MLAEGGIFAGMFAGDTDLAGTTLRSIFVSSGATLAASALAIPLGAQLAHGRWRGRRVAIAVLNAGMGMPTVLVGLLLLLALWREGPLGEWALLYTPTALVMGQTIIAFPIVGALTVAAVQALRPAIRVQIEALGADSAQRLWLLIREARLGIAVAVLGGFGHALSEVGAAMMLGGNLPGQTRVLTTATLQAARMGQFDLAIGLASLLFVLALLVNGGAAALAGRERA